MKNAKSGGKSKDTAGASRRRFILGATPMAVTLASRPALASVCAVSGTLSGNMSRPDAVDCRGLSPEFWRANPGQWPKYVPGPCNPLSQEAGVCTDYSVPSTKALAKAVKKHKLTQAAVDAYLLAPKGTKFTFVFGHGLTNTPKLTLMQALWGQGESDDDDDDDSDHGDDDDDDDDDDGDDGHHGAGGGGGLASVLAHAVAAILNSVYFGHTQFGFTEGEIVHMVATMISSGQEEQLLADLQALNCRG